MGRLHLMGMESQFGETRSSGGQWRWLHTSVNTDKALNFTLDVARAVDCMIRVSQHKKQKRTRALRHSTEKRNKGTKETRSALFIGNVIAQKQAKQSKKSIYIYILIRTFSRFAGYKNQYSKLSCISIH